MKAEVFMQYHWTSLNVAAMVIFTVMFVAMIVWVFMLRKETVSYFESLPLKEE